MYTSEKWMFIKTEQTRLEAWKRKILKTIFWRKKKQQKRVGQKNNWGNKKSLQRSEHNKRGKNTNIKKARVYWEDVTDKNTRMVMTRTIGEKEDSNYKLTDERRKQNMEWNENG